MALVADELFGIQLYASMSGVYGCCYLRFVDPNYVMQAFTLLGYWPTVDMILSAPKEFFSLAWRWRNLVLVGSGLGERHVEYNSVLSDKMGVDAFSFFLAAARKKETCEIGSLAHCLMTYEVEELVDSSLVVRIGGSRLRDFSEVVVPIASYQALVNVGGPSVAEAYFNAIASYYSSAGAFSGKAVPRIADVMEKDVAEVKPTVVDEPIDVGNEKVLLRITDVIQDDFVDTGVLSGKSGITEGVCQLADKVIEQSNSVSGISVGANYERIKLNRQQKKERKKKRQAMGVDWRKNKELPKVNSSRNVSSTELRASLEKKWIAENELAVTKAERQLAVLRANDIDAEVRKYRTSVCVATERNMVAIEKVHGQLKADGNVSEDDDSRVHTIIDGSSVSGTQSSSISPGSSASMVEFRAVQKKNLDLEEMNNRYTKAFEKMGISLDAFEAKDKSVWTDNPENHAILCQLYPDGYGMSFDNTPKGKFSVF